MSLLLPSEPDEQAHPQGDDAAGVLVNKKELAALIGISLPTLDSWLDRFGDAFPVRERGTNGRDWRFDAADVIAFLREQRAAEEAEAVECAERLKQFALPGLDAASDMPGGVTKAADLLALAKVRQMQRREAAEAGLLVPTADVRRALGATLVKLDRFLQSVLTQLARKHGWPAPVMADACAMFGEAKARFVTEAGVFAPDAAPAPALFDSPTSAAG